MKKILLLISLISQLVSAQTRQVNLKDESLKNFIKLQQAGINDIGPINIDKFIKNAHKVSFEVLSGSFIASKGNRSSAVQIQNRLIISSFGLQNYSLNRIRDLLQHELLGALGFEDENYRLSIAISLLADQADSKKFLEENSFFKEILNSTYRLNKKRMKYDTSLLGQELAASGGATGVGGGGDLSTIEIKNILIEAYSNLDGKISYDEYVAKILNANIEGVVCEKRQEVVKVYYYADKPRVRIPAIELISKDCQEYYNVDESVILFDKAVYESSRTDSDDLKDFIQLIVNKIFG